MANLNRVDLLWQLLVDAHPKFCVSLRERNTAPTLLNKPKDSSEATLVDYERAEAWHDWLQLQTDAKLNELLESQLERKRAAEEAKHPFNLPDALATDDVFEFWSRAELWTLGETAALICGRSPAVVYEDKINADRTDSKIAIKLKQTLELLSRAHLSGSLNRMNSPKDVINWLELKHIEMPQSLKDMALQRSGTTFTVNAENKLLKKRLAALEAPQAPSDNEGTAGSAEKPISARERESLLKLILGMAICAYRYDPKATKSKEVTEIAGDLETAGLALEPDTVRKYLNEAKALFADALTEQKG